MVGNSVHQFCSNKRHSNGLRAKTDTEVWANCRIINSKLSMRDHFIKLPWHKKTNFTIKIRA